MSELRVSWPRLRRERAATKNLVEALWLGKGSPPTPEKGLKRWEMLECKRLYFPKK